MTTELWVCHKCEMIGSRTQAIRHSLTLRHAIVQVPADLADGIIRRWADEAIRNLRLDEAA